MKKKEEEKKREKAKKSTQNISSSKKGEGNAGAGAGRGSGGSSSSSSSSDGSSSGNSDGGRKAGASGGGWGGGRRGGRGRERGEGEVRMPNHANANEAIQENARRWIKGEEAINVVLYNENKFSTYSQSDEVNAMGQGESNLRKLKKSHQRTIAWLGKACSGPSGLETVIAQLKHSFVEARSHHCNGGSRVTIACLDTAQRREYGYDIRTERGAAYLMSIAEEEQFNQLWKFYDLAKSSGCAEGAVRVLAQLVWLPMQEAIPLRGIEGDANGIGGWKLALYNCYMIREAALEDREGIYNTKLLAVNGVVLGTDKSSGLDRAAMMTIAREAVRQENGRGRTGQQQHQQQQQQQVPQSQQQQRYRQPLQHQTQQPFQRNPGPPPDCVWGVTTRLVRGVAVPWLPMLREVETAKDGTALLGRGGGRYTGPTCEHCQQAGNQCQHHPYQCYSKYPNWISTKPWADWLKTTDEWQRMPK